MNSRGMQAYYIRVQTQRSWPQIAKELGYASHTGCRHAAKKYSTTHNLPWPINYMGKGEAIYKAKIYGIGWRKISIIYKQPMRVVRQLANRYANRHNRQWPPTTEKRHE